MCGILGIINIDKNQVDRNDLQQCAAFLKERGPDHTGYWIKDNIGFVHARLSIIDLEERSNQPMINSETNNVITFNGEIYNYRELRKELINKGISFKTNSDTEVLLQGFNVWGIDRLLEKINGMFAFAILNHKEDKLYLARDSFGKKPLYYYSNLDSFLFSSDIRAIHSLKKASLNIDYQSIDYYLTELSAPQPKTIWREIQQVKPAHYIEISLATGALEEKPFWKLQQQKWAFNINETIDYTEQKLIEAINRRTNADVPLGCFLSGGVDSGLIVSLLAQQSTEQISTFSIGLDYEEEMNELSDAKTVADRYNTNHHEIILKAQVLEDLPKLIDYIGEPFADSSIIPSYHVTKAISNQVTVAISGDGGDELFGGYNDYGLAYRTDRYLEKYPNSSLRKSITLLNKLTSRLVGKSENYGAYEHYNLLEGADRLYRQMGFSFSQKNSLYHPNNNKVKPGFSRQYLNSIWAENHSSSLTNTLLKSSLNTRLLNDYLVKVDRASMINSLEVRSPLLDKELAQMAFSIPKEFKFHNNINKYILKKLAQRHVDTSILTRKKRGFGIPVKTWLQKDMNGWMKEILFDPSVQRRALFNCNYIEKTISEHEQYGNKTNSLWALICLELWFNKYLP